uniref:Putative triabin n=1 Tax=Panstrongylus lignarius TaxID=156445 RepID=A0A224XS51_9HEMI
MKTIIAFFVILMCAFAQVSSESGECQRNAISGFSLDKYLKLSHAYATNAKQGSSSTVCREFNTTRNSGGMVVISVYGHYEYSSVIA